MTKIHPDNFYSLLFLHNSLDMYTIHYVISCLFRFIELYVQYTVLVQRTSMCEYKYSLLRSVESRPRRRPRLLSHKYKKCILAFIVGRGVGRDGRRRPRAADAVKCKLYWLVGNSIVYTPYQGRSYHRGMGGNCPPPIFIAPPPTFGKLKFTIENFNSLMVIN